MQDKFLVLLFARAIRPAARGREFQRVEDEVQDDFFQLVAVRQHGAEGGIDEGFQPQPFVFGHLPRGAGQALDEFRRLPAARA